MSSVHPRVFKKSLRNIYNYLKDRFNISITYVQNNILSFKISSSPGNLRISNNIRTICMRGKGAKIQFNMKNNFVCIKMIATACRQQTRKPLHT